MQRMKHVTTKLLRIAIPTREGLENKWWHRLVVVLIYGSTIAVFLFLLMLALQEILNKDFKWKLYEYTYSFEKGYNTAKGKEEKCNIRKNEDTVYVSCGDIKTKTELLNKIAESKDKVDELVKMRFSYVHFEKRPSLSELMEAAEKFDNDMILNGVNNGDFQNLRVKVNSQTRYLVIPASVFFAIVLAILWFICLYSILYRTALYVIYGSSKVASNSTE